MTNKEIAIKGQEYVMNTYGRLPVAMVKGEGAKVWDADGNEYLDFVSGIAVNALGHAHPKVVNAISKQAGKVIHCSNLYWIPNQVKLAQQLVENSVFDKVFFANSGAEANEGAIKLARKYSWLKNGEKEKYEIITMNHSFHGRTLATLTATGQTKYQKGFTPLPPGFKYVPFNDFEALENAISPQTCAIMLEPVQGEGGVNVPDHQYLQKVYKLCKEKDLLLIFDEVQTGVGRAGTLFAYEQFGIEPDIMTLAKALAGGAPIGALLAKDKIAAAFNPGDHASTFGGNPLVTSAALAVLEVFREENILENVRKVGKYLKEKLKNLQNKYSFVKQVRGLGLIIGMELTIPGNEIVNSCFEKGLLINCTNQTVLRFLPPLIITEKEVDKAVRILDEAMEKSKKNFTNRIKK